MESAMQSSEVLLVPWGSTVANGIEFNLDEESAEMVISEFNKHGVHLPVDYEHASLGGEYGTKDGSAPAAGWIKWLRSVPGKGLLGIVEWTNAAANMIKEKAYKYISPVVLARVSDKRVLQLHSAGLTNKPAIPNMPPLSTALA